MNIEIPDGSTQEQISAAIAQALANGRTVAGNTLDLNQIPRSYDEAVKLLAAWHGSDAPDSVVVYLLQDPELKTVQFVEVSKEFGDDDNFRPVSMGASRDFPFRSSIVLISSADWERIKNNEKRLPEGWDLDKLKQVWPNA